MPIQRGGKVQKVEPTCPPHDWEQKARTVAFTGNVLKGKYKIVTLHYECKRADCRKTEKRVGNPERIK